MWVMLPMVRTLWEAKQVLEIMKEEGLERSRDFKIWFMAETPAIAIMADEFSKLVQAGKDTDSSEGKQTEDKERSKVPEA